MQPSKHSNVNNGLSAVSSVYLKCTQQIELQTRASSVAGMVDQPGVLGISSTFSALSPYLPLSAAGQPGHAACVPGVMD